MGIGKTFTPPDSLGLLTEKEADALMKYSSKGSLLEELKSAGFTVPSGCPDTVILRDICIEKSYGVVVPVQPDMVFMYTIRLSQKQHATSISRICMYIHMESLLIMFPKRI